jgi:hypothetical protein
LGFVNLGNGNLHQEITLGTFPQKGNTPPLTFKLIYDSRIWQNFGPSSVWNSQNVKNNQGQASWGGWRFQDTARGWLELDTFPIPNCGQIAFPYWHSVDGSLHFLNFTPNNITNPACGTSTATGSGPSIDSTAFLYQVTNFTFGSSSPQGTITARDGSLVFPTPTDTNGNVYSVNTNGDLVDTLGRVPVQTTTNCNNNPNQICYDVLNSESVYTQGSSPQGPRSRYTVTLTTISVNTAFGESELTECSTNCTLQVISSIALPDGTSYSFTYDSGTSPGNYGELSSVTLPSGGTINYTYATYEDLNGNRNRWANSWSDSTTGGTWTFNPQLITQCALGTQNCQQQLTRTSPTGDDTVFNFTIINGAWKSSERNYSGGSTSGGTLLKTTTTNYTMNNPCLLSTPFNCESSTINEMDATVTLPTVGGNSIVKKTQLNFANPLYGDVTSISEWMFHSGSLPSTPDRTTYISYQNATSYISANILDRPTSIAVCSPSGTDPACGGAGTPLSKITLSYDSTTPTGMHGNLSQINQWLNEGTDSFTIIKYDNY